MSKDRQAHVKTTSDDSKRTGKRWHPRNWFSSAAPDDGSSGGTAKAAKSSVPTTRRRKIDGDDVRLWYRSTERVFYQNGAWFIATREGIDVGPYANSAAARRDAKRLIELLAHDARTGRKNHVLTIQEFMLRPRLRHRD